MKMNTEEKKHDYKLQCLMKLGDSGGKIVRKLQTVNGDMALKLLQVYRWAGQFLKGREFVVDNPQAGRPVSTRNEENVKRIDDLLATNRRISVCYISDMLGINCETVCLITDDLHIRKLCACMVPKSLMAEQKQR